MSLEEKLLLLSLLGGQEELLVVMLLLLLLMLCCCCHGCVDVHDVHGWLHGGLIDRMHQLRSCCVLPGAVEWFGREVAVQGADCYCSRLKSGL